MPPLVLRLSRFAAVGGAAALTHWTVVTAIVTATKDNPLYVNVLGFLIALSVSYMGHKNWTFGAEEKNHKDTLPKFFVVAIAGFLINEASLAFLYQSLKIDYRVSLFFAIAVAAASTYVFSSIWAFSKTRTS